MELNLDLSLNYVPKKVSEILEQVSICKSKDDKFVILDNYVKRLEDELKKIEAFKRELPLCMILLNDVIAKLRDEMKHYSKACNEKKEWMSSVQLWTSSFDSETQQRMRIEAQDDRSVPENPIQVQDRSRRCEAFLPFKGISGCTRNGDDKDGSRVPSLSLMSPMFDLDSSCKSGGGSSELVLQSRTYQEQQQHQQGFRKQRRCWSPELHRRFVEALQQLGGSQAATPKQIRELMQVDGLTNDEVKSHLQKYRLHVRRLPAPSTDAITGVRMAHDRDGEHHKANISQSHSPQGPLHTSASGKAISSVGYESMDAEEDERSEVRSWEVALHNAA